MSAWNALVRASEHVRYEFADVWLPPFEPFAGLAGVEVEVLRNEPHPDLTRWLQAGWEIRASFPDRLPARGRTVRLRRALSPEDAILRTLNHFLAGRPYDPYALWSS